MAGVRKGDSVERSEERLERGGEAGVATVALVGTLDTKGPDFAFLAGRLRAAGVEVIVVDAGTGDPVGLAPDMAREPR
jgi:hypothetical protein